MKLDSKKKLIIFIVLLNQITFAYTRSDQQHQLDSYKLQYIIDNNKVGSLEELIFQLPIEVKSNFVLKHGILREGENGHLVEKKVSQSSDPDLPRAILWDEVNGFSVSFNGGGEKQTAPQRLDILSFDKTSKKFDLKAIHFSLSEEQIKLGILPKKIVNDTSCKNCHGPLSRPIFSMYPDWPSFYGSMNDELNDPNFKVQELEYSDFKIFKNSNAIHNKRYSPLFDPTISRQLYNLDIWETYPYRQNTITTAQEVSRSFAFRPGLRLGIVYNRLTAQMVFQLMKSNSNYEKMKGLVLHSLLQCNWNSSYPKTREMIKTSIEKTNIKFKRPEDIQLNYYDIWKIFGLKINDIDIRYSYNHEGYLNENATNNIMHPGYIDKYFNSYFDGTATIDELIVGHIVSDLTKDHPQFFSKVKLRGLVEKYKHLEERFKYDKSIFENFDRLGMWFPIPYPKNVFEKHHREYFSEKMKEDYNFLCLKTSEFLKSQFIK